MILLVLWYPMLHAKFHGHWSTGSGEEVLKIFTIYGRGGHIGHITWTVKHIFVSEGYI